MHITQPQLRGYGATPYLNQVILQKISPIGKENRFNLYPIDLVVRRIEDRLKNPRISFKNRALLDSILDIILNPDHKIIPVPFGSQKGTDTELSQLAQRALFIFRKTDHYLSDISAEIATLKGKNIIKGKVNHARLTKAVKS